MSNIPSKMNALVAYAPHDYRLEVVDVPKVGKGEMLIKVEACGICAGDIKAFLGAPSFWGTDGHPKYIKEPVIPGHEFVGHIVELGEDCKGNFKLGDRVISEQIVPCWDCKFCNTGKHWMCQKHDLYGFQNNVHGGMAEYMKFTKEAIVYHVPNDIPTESAILIEPYACSKHCIDRSQMTNEDFVVLSGAGPLGLGMVGCIKLKNPQKLVVIDLREDRLERAKAFGADVVMNPAKENVVQKIHDMTEGYGCDVYIEATGHGESVVQGLQAIRKMGTFVEFSVFKDPTTVDWSIISDRKELNLYGVHLSPYCYEPVIQWIRSKQLPTEQVVTHSFHLKDWKEAFDTTQDPSKKSIKVIFTKFD